MSKVTALKPDAAMQTGVVSELRDMLERAERGEFVGVWGLAELPGGQYFHFGSSTYNRLQTSGALLELAIERLKT